MIDEQTHHYIIFGEKYWDFATKSRWSASKKMGKSAMEKWHFCNNSCVVNLSKLKKNSKNQKKTRVDLQMGRTLKKMDGETQTLHK